MTAARARVTPRRRRRPGKTGQLRFTVDASVFVNAFNPHEDGHAGSLALLAEIHDRGHPVIVPTLLLAEIASALARATDDGAGALRYALAISRLPHLTLVPVTAAVAHQAAEVATANRLRGADAVYVTVARRYGTMLVTRDEEQRARGAAIVPCRTPEGARSST
jgi:predicted nucleic acid-binding protein